MFLRKIRQKVYTLRLDSIVNFDSSLSKKEVSNETQKLDSIVKFDSSLSIQSYFETSDFKTVLNRIRKGSGEEIPTYDGTGSFIRQF